VDEPNGVLDWSDLEFDLAGARRRAELLECLRSDRQPPGPSRDLRIRRPGGAAPTADEPNGEHFIARRPADLRARYRTVLHLEAGYAADLDFGCLIASTCQVLESELEQLLVSPARPIGALLASALADRGKAKQAEMLAAWAEGKYPATMSTSSLLLMALRYGLENEKTAEASRAFLARHFRAPYLDLVRAGQLGATLDRVREKYRNNACHGLKPFGPGDYQQFSRLVIGRARFAEWKSGGPLPEATAGTTSLLHHHLVASLLVPAAAAAELSPTERLLALAEPRGSRCSVRVELRHADAEPPTDLSSGPARQAQPFRVGAEVCYYLQAGQDCQVALIDVGTGGSTSVLLPSAVLARTDVRANQVLAFPDAARDGVAIEVGGPAGRERGVALAFTRGAPRALAPPPGEDLRVLSAAEVASLCEELARRDPGEWAAAACDFEVVA
jgi:hypothetical protein